MSTNVVQLFPRRVVEEQRPHDMSGLHDVMGTILEWGESVGIDVQTAEFVHVCADIMSRLQMQQYRAAA